MQINKKYKCENNKVTIISPKSDHIFFDMTHIRWSLIRPRGTFTSSCHVAQTVCKDSNEFLSRWRTFKSFFSRQFCFGKDGCEASDLRRLDAAAPPPDHYWAGPKFFRCPTSVRQGAVWLAHDNPPSQLTWAANPESNSASHAENSSFNRWSWALN